MGFHPIRRIRVERLYGEHRKLLLTYFDDESNEHTTETFGWDEEDKVLERIGQLLKQKSM